ncbi:MAG: transcription elongation factor NusA [Candidatus Aenigmarchaeota archaeon]|nr:transcription elongation factor NusA [Candidatus Aenigmarchaeota archaeon]
MKAPICEICIKSGILCKSCEEKLRKGEISKADVRVSSVLLGLSGEKKMLRDATLVRVIELPDMYVLIAGNGDAPKIIGANGQTARRLEKELGKRVMIVEQAGDMKEFMENLVKPFRVVSVSTVYKDGHEVLRLNIGKGRGARISSADFSSIVKAIYGKDAELFSE